MAVTRSGFGQTFLRPPPPPRTTRERRAQSTRMRVAVTRRGEGRHSLRPRLDIGPHGGDLCVRATPSSSLRPRRSEAPSSRPLRLVVIRQALLIRATPSSSLRPRRSGAPSSRRGRSKGRRSSRAGACRAPSRGRRATPAGTAPPRGEHSGGERSRGERQGGGASNSTAVRIARVNNNAVQITRGSDAVRIARLF